MNVLFLHPTFPGQFLQLAMHLGADKKNKVIYLSQKGNGSKLKGVQVGIYQEPSVNHCHKYLDFTEKAVEEGRLVINAITDLHRQTGFMPDVIIGHTGWGSTLYVKDILSQVPLIGYFEWFYNPDDARAIESRCRIRTTNAHIFLSLDACDVRYTPSYWQRAQFPLVYQDSMKVIPEGVDTDFFQPRHGAKLVLPRARLNLSGCNEIVTYLSRGMEPIRGFPEFMESVRILLKRRPKCHIVIAGGENACYGLPYSEHQTWKQVEEAKGGYDKDRVHFVGHLNRDEYLMFLQSSTVHVYLTRPFILSWSFLEAMGAGCCIVSSKTAPVQDVMTDRIHGLLADINSPEDIALRVEEALDSSNIRKTLGNNAREIILEQYDLKKCLQKQMQMVNEACL